jgi:aspartate/methionine/tyrosine aminotransferase
MDISKYLATRTKHIHSGRQTSVAIPGLINMGSGTPDFEPPAFIFEAMQEALDKRKIQYTLWAGIPELRQAIAQKVERQNHFKVDPELEVMVTSGAQEALVTVLMTLLDPGDNVLTPSPHYGVYGEAAEMLGAVLIPVMTTLESNFTIDVEALAAAITPKTKALIIVTPNNPTGTVIPETTLRQIAELAVERNLLVISDEIYEDYLFDGHKHVSLATFPGMRERTICLYSLSKGYALTGVRVGYIVAPANLIEAMLPFHHAMTICANSIAQYGAAAALSQPRDWFTPILSEYDRRRQLWMKTLGMLGLPYSKPQGAYYVAVDISATGLSSSQFSQRLRDEAKIVMGTSGEKLMRASLMQKSPQFEEGLERFGKFVKSL